MGILVHYFAMSAYLHITVAVRIRIVHSRIRNHISVHAGINTGISLSIQQIINVSISHGDSMTVNIIRVYVFVFVGASMLMYILLSVFIL